MFLHVGFGRTEGFLSCLLVHPVGLDLIGDDPLVAWLVGCLRAVLGVTTYVSFFYKAQAPCYSYALYT